NGPRRAAGGALPREAGASAGGAREAQHPEPAPVRHDNPAGRPEQDPQVGREEHRPAGARGREPEPAGAAGRLEPDAQRVAGPEMRSEAEERARRRDGAEAAGHAGYPSPRAPPPPYR